MPATIAIMQPYFIPYGGYFRLITGSDLFVIYDCVQFPRRGWVHRNQLLDRNGQEDWLTLPLDKAPRDVLIKDLAFAPDAQTRMDERLRHYALETPRSAPLAPVLEKLRRVEGAPVAYIVGLLEAVCAHLGFPWNAVYSSTLAVPDSFRGEDRILEIIRRVGASRYLNAPGGRELYNHDTFAAQGVTLQFLPPYAGAKSSILQRLLDSDRDDLIAEINDWVPEA